MREGNVATVTKAKLARMLARDLCFTEVLAHKVVDAFFEIMREAVQRGDRIEVRGFGSWTVKTTNARPNARNPRTGEVVVVPARRKVRFKPGRIIKVALAQPKDAPRVS